MAESPVVKMAYEFAQYYATKRRPLTTADWKGRFWPLGVGNRYIILLLTPRSSFARRGRKNKTPTRSFSPSLSYAKVLAIRHVILLEGHQARLAAAGQIAGKLCASSCFPLSVCDCENSGCAQPLTRPFQVVILTIKSRSIATSSGRAHNLPRTISRNMQRGGHKMLSGRTWRSRTSGRYRSWCRRA